jgi:nucleotide-binding universal stress UspA family protein
MVAQITKIERKYATAPQTARQKLRVFIPYDGSKAAEATLENLSSAGLPDELEALIAVMQVWLPLSPDEISSAVSARRLKLLSSGLASHVPALQDYEEQRVLSLEAERKLRVMFPKGLVRTEAIQDTAAVAQAILRNAKQWGAELIIVGSKNSPSSQITDYAGPALRVAKDAHCSVRIVRPSQRTPDSATRILICLDEGASSQNVMNAVSERSWPIGTIAHVVLVQKPGLHHAARAAGTDVLNTWTNTLRATGLEVSIGTEHGAPEEVVLLGSRASPVDCVFIDPHYGRPEGFDSRGLSDVAAAVVLGAPCSVEVVRANSSKNRYLDQAA